MIERNPIGLLIKPWASSVDAIIRPPEADGISRSEGLPDEFNLTNFIHVGLFNQWLSELTAFLKDAEKYGIIPWVGDLDESQLETFSSSRNLNYLDGEMVLGSDDQLYVCIQSSGSLDNDPITDVDHSHWQLMTDDLEEYGLGAVVLGSDGSLYRCRQSTGSLTTDPTTDSNENVWELLIRTVDEATEVSPGTIRLATIAESRAGTATNRAVTPAGLAAAITDQIATLQSDGVVNGASISGTELTITRSNNLTSITVDLAGLLTSLAPTNDPTFTGSVRGPQQLLSDNSHTAATTDFVRSLADQLFTINATESREGIARPATESELTTGTADNVFITVAGLESQVEDLSGPLGPQGFRGADVRGETGPDGEIGPDGFQGLQGRSIPGEQGDQGDPGQGIPGAKGLIGERGASFTGAVGEKGPKGRSIPGEQGEQGEPGRSIPGADGDPGDRGDQGPRGYTGLQGQRGQRGNRGPRGDDASSTGFVIPNPRNGVITYQDSLYYYSHASGYRNLGRLPPNGLLISASQNNLNFYFFTIDELRNTYNSNRNQFEGDDGLLLYYDESDDSVFAKLANPGHNPNSYSEPRTWIFI